LSSNSSEKQNLYIIITNSLQNDFIENKHIEKIKQDTPEEPWKIDYELCEEKWMEFFRDKRRTDEEKNINSFLKWIEKWMETNVLDPKSREIIHSYHKFFKYYDHRVHVDVQESERLWYKDKLTNFITDLMNKGAESNRAESRDVYEFIHLRDWHDPTGVSQRDEIINFGIHCIKGSHGAKFILPLADYIEKFKTFNQVINSNSLSSFSDTNLEHVLKTIIDNNNSSNELAKIGIFGVITNVKLKLLTFELKVVNEFKNVYVCGDLCAGFNDKGHADGLNYMKNILGVKVYNEQKFRKKFNFPKPNY